MRILIICTVSTEKNGITNVIFNYLRAINTSDIRFDYVSINQPEQMYIDVVEKRGGKVYVVQRSGKKIISYFRQLTHIVANGRYDAVHIHTNSHTSVLELMAAKIGGCKKRIVHAHTTSCGSLIIHKLLAPIFNTLYTNGLACGEKAGHFMFGSNKFQVVNNGVDTNKFAFKAEIRDDIRKQLGLKNADILLGHVGYFLELKNQKFIVKIFNELHKRNNQYKLILIGDGPLRKDVEKQVNDYGLKNDVCFTGNIDNVFAYLNAIDVIVMPSLYEGLPLTLIEQQANGLHCVVSDTITKEVDKTGNVSFVSLNDHLDVWADSITSISNENCREMKSKKAIANITAEGYSIQREAKKLKTYYLSL